MTAMLLEQMKLLTSIAVSDKTSVELKEYAAPLLKKMFSIVGDNISEYEKEVLAWKQQSNLAKAGIIH